MEKNFYESVDDKSLPWDISKKSTKKRINATKCYMNNISSNLFIWHTLMSRITDFFRNFQLK